ncbi:MAG: monovalent cation/H+ antiporter subunit D [Herbaspirillum sp.]
MMGWQQHLVIYPILVPLLAAAIMLLTGESLRRVRVAISLFATVVQLLVALILLDLVARGVGTSATDAVLVYRVGGWSAPFGIVLVADRLSAVMLVLSAVLALLSLIYAMGRWDRLGPHFKPLFQLLLMGVNGVFLTGDLFNLFVFVEVLLVASYGLLLHGSGAPRVRAGLHYIAVNLFASLLFLIGAALIYGVTGTLNMADIAQRSAQLVTGDRTLFEVGAAVLGVAFLIKAGVWPLNFWLPATYSTAAAPVAAMFSILTKIGIYMLLRFGTLFSSFEVPLPFHGDWLFGIGLVTIVFGVTGMLTVQQPQRMVAHCVIVSAGTLLAALGYGGTVMVGPALFYLISSVLATGAFFMIAEMIERSRSFGANVLAISFETFGMEDPLDPDRPDDVVGVVIPAALAFLGLGFISCALLVTGLPPLSGFIAKFSILSTALSTVSVATAPLPTIVLILAILGSGLAGLVALCRMGMRIFWSSDNRITPRLRPIEAGPPALLVVLCLALTVGAGPVINYLNATGVALSQPQNYINAVLTKSVVAPGSNTDWSAD